MKIKNIILLIIISSMLVGCKGNEKYNVSIYDSDKYVSYVSDVANDGIVTTLDKSWWDGVSIKETFVRQSMSVDIDGTKRTGKYKKTDYGRNGWKKERTYQTDEGFKFYVDAESNKVIGFFYGGSSTWREKELSIDNTLITKENAETIAKEYVGKYIEISNYTIEYSVSSIQKKDGTELPIHTFRFVKHAGNFKTNDWARIEVTANGNIRGFSINNIGAFDSIQLEQIDQKKVDEVIDLKINDLYKNKTICYEYKIVEQTLSYTPENDFVIISYIELDLTFAKDMQSESLLELATVIGKVSK